MLQLLQVLHMRKVVRAALQCAISGPRPINYLTHRRGGKCEMGNGKWRAEMMAQQVE